MSNHIVSSLQLYKKPEKDFLKDKECLICLETIDLEVAKIVKLPCGCSNSVYHVVCIAQLLSSGKNKNFCPHCKSNYELTLQQVVQPSNLIAVQPNTENEQTRLLSYIIIVHIFSNSIMNLINIGLSHDYSKNDANIISKILQISYFCKILVNVCIIINLKVNVKQINSHLSLSYIIQTVLFVITDLGFRIRIECKGMNRVNVIESV